MLIELLLLCKASSTIVTPIWGRLGSNPFNIGEENL